jgi:hypothetical protein
MALRSIFDQVKVDDVTTRSHKLGEVFGGDHVIRAAFAQELKVLPYVSIDLA